MMHFLGRVKASETIRGGSSNCGCYYIVCDTEKACGCKQLASGAPSIAGYGRSTAFVDEVADLHMINDANVMWGENDENRSNTCWPGLLVK